MKQSSTFVLLAFFSSFTIAMLVSACCGFDCQDDVLIEEEVKQLFPFEPGDQVRYVSSSSDTLVYTCSERKFFNFYGYIESEVYRECCGEYILENMRILFGQPEIEASLGLIHNNNYGPSASFIALFKIRDSTAIGGSWPEQFNNPELEKLDEIQLAGKVFYNVYQPENGQPIYLEPDSLGIVGFILDGKEWRKL